MIDHEPPGGRYLAVAVTMAVDALTAEVLEAFAVAGVRPLLLKGPALACWLYDDQELRPYGDVDLLVSPAQHTHAEAVLTSRGFVRHVRDYEVAHRLEHDAVWVRRGSQVSVDLHRTLPAVRGASPEAVWRELSPHAVEMQVSGVERPVLVLDEGSRALLVAVHAAHHLGEGSAGQQALDDLARAVDRAPAEAWARARILARRLRAEPQLARGLSLVPSGAALAARLDLPDPSSQREELAGIERLIAARSPAARLRVLARALVPAPSYLRWSSQLARRGPRGLAMAYLLHPLVQLAHLPRAYVVWRRHRAHAGATSPQRR